MSWKSFGILVLMHCTGFAVSQNSSGRGMPVRHADAANRQGSFNQSTLRFQSRFRGWRQTSPDTFPQKLNTSAVAAPSGRVAGGRQIRASSTQITPPLNGFGFRPDLPAGQIPTAVATADFNGDGKLDWAISNGQDNTIWLYFGNGDGTSSLPAILPLRGLSPTWLIETDLNGDGKPDLVVAEADTSTVGVFLGKGDGTFQPEVEYTVPAPPLFLIAADFNGDGHVDVAAGMIGTTATGPVAVLPGNGHGQLGAAVYTPDPDASTGYWVTPASLRGNGKLDLIVVDPDDLGPHGGVQVYLNNGDGSFTAGQFVFGNEAPPDTPPDLMLSAAVGDINSDGCSDLVVTNSYGLAFIFGGGCDGTFAYPPAQYALGDIGVTVQLLDVNGDGKLDMVTSGAYLSSAGGPGFGNVAGDQVSVLLGDGNGGFSQGRTYRGDASMYSLGIGDVNGDGFPDLISANQGSNTASVFLNDGKGGFGDPQGVSFGNSVGDSSSPDTPLAFADIDGNGTTDMVIVDNPPYPGSPMQITAFLNDGTGKFSAPIVTPAWPTSTTLFPGNVTLADFRNTGRPDLLLVGNANSPPFVYFAPNIGAGQFGPYTMTTPVGASGPVAVGDFNRDGKLDFVTAADNYDNDSQQLYVFLGNGDGTFRAGQTLTFANGIGTPTLAFTGDFNADGNLDVIIWNEGLWDFLGNGDGTFRAPIPVLANVQGGLVMADFNHDGLPDIMTACDPAGFTTDGIFSVYLGQPDGSFQYSASYTPYLNFFDGPIVNGIFTPLNPFPGLVGDFNGDGNPDVALFPFMGSFFVDPAMEVFYGNGDGTFTPSYVNYPLYSPFAPEFAVDINGDGLTDLLELNNYTPSFDAIKSSPAGPKLQLELLTVPLTGTTGTGRVFLGTQATAPTSVSFLASDSAVTVPGVTILAGSVSQDFTFSIGSGFNRLSVFSIEAQAGAATAIAYDYVSTPPLPVLEMTPAKVLFKGGVAGGPGITLPITVKNIGAAVFTVSQRQTDPYFTETDNCGTNLAPGASCTIHVTFTPTFPGDASGTVSLQDLVTGVFASSALEGDVLSPLQISPCCLWFSGVAGETIAPQAITLNNVSSSAIQMTSIASSGSGIAQTNDCNTIAAKSSCQISVTFSPTAEGSTVGSLTLDTNVPIATAFVVPITGNAGDFSLGTAAAQTISPGATATYNLSATSNGGFAGNVSLTCSGGPPGATCSVAPTSVSLSGDGTSPYVVSVTTSANALIASAPQKRLLTRRMPFIALLSMFSLVIYVQTRRQRLARSLFAVSGLGLIVLLVSCGGGGSTSGGTSPQPTAYTLTVTGTVGSVSHATKLTLNVQP